MKRTSNTLCGIFMERFHRIFHPAAACGEHTENTPTFQGLLQRLQAAHQVLVSPRVQHHSLFLGQTKEKRSFFLVPQQERMMATLEQPSEVYLDN